ncbi:uncharacterized protein A4U43_C08F14430 [Asparagus officinalis]|nr:uncharacterized protein A4U43_C08F14430 [Asparagus officinalis]
MVNYDIDAYINDTDDFDHEDDACTSAHASHKTSCAKKNEVTLIINTLFLSSLSIAVEPEPVVITTSKPMPPLSLCSLLKAIIDEAKAIIAEAQARLEEAQKQKQELEAKFGELADEHARRVKRLRMEHD